MEKRPVEFNLVEWLILTDLVKASPKKYEDKGYKGSDVYNLEELAMGCGGPLWDVGPTERKQRAALVTKLEGYIGEGHRYIEFRPFDDGGDATG